MLRRPPSISMLVIVHLRDGPAGSFSLSLQTRHGECRGSLTLSAATAIVSHVSIGEVAQLSAVETAQS